MMKKELNEECERCAVRARQKCKGQYHELCDDDLPPFESASLMDLFDGGCSEKLVTVIDGEVFINYDCQYSIGSLSRLNKKKFAEFLVHLSEKDWFTTFVAKVLIRRVFELKKWKDPCIILNLKPILES